MSSIVSYQPPIGEEVLEGEVFTTYTKEDIDRALSYKNKQLGKTQFYNWLKHCEIRPNRSNCYSQSEYDRLLYFALLMKRYGSIKTAKLKFHQRYPQENLQEESIHDHPKQHYQRVRTEATARTAAAAAAAPASDIASIFGF